MSETFRTTLSLASKAGGEGHEIKVVPGWCSHHPQITLQEAGPSTTHLTGHGEIENDLGNDDASSNVQDPHIPAEETQGGMGLKDKGSTDAKSDQHHGSQNAIDLQR